MTNLLIIALLFVFMVVAAKSLAATLIGIGELCGKIARMVDRTPDRLIILGALSFAVLFTGFMVLGSHHH